MHMYDVAVREHLVDESALDVDAPRAATGKVADELLETRWYSERVLRDHVQEAQRARLEPRVRSFFALFCAAKRRIDETLR